MVMQLSRRVSLCIRPKSSKKISTYNSKAPAAKEAAEKFLFSVIPSEARNPSSIETQEKRDSSARSMPRNDGVSSFSATCKAALILIALRYG